MADILKIAAWQGPMYVSALDATTFLPTGGFEWVGDVSDFSVVPSSEFAEHTESFSGLRLRTDRWRTGLNYMIRFTCSSMTADRIADAVAGTKAAVSGASVTNEQLAGSDLPTVGKYYPLAYHGSTITSVTIEDSTPTTPKTYTLGTHYTIDAWGTIKIIANPASAVGPVLVDYTYANHTKVDIGTALAPERSIIVNQMNIARSGAKSAARFWRAQWGTAEELRTISEQRAEARIEAALLPDFANLTDHAALSGLFGRFV